MSKGGIEDWTPLDFVKVGGGLAAFFLACLVVLWVGRRQSAEYASWTEVPCEIVSNTTMVSSTRGQGDPNRMTVLTVYRYTIDGTSYENEDYGAPEGVDPSKDRIELSEFLEQGGAVGTRDHCFVDPKDPTRSVFRYIPTSNLDDWFKPLWWTVFGCLLIAGFGLFRRARTGSW